MKRLAIWTDGGARGNPGPSAIGVVVKAGSVTRASFGRTIGQTTNNQAEYGALIAGLETALELGGTHLTCYLDSLLVVSQMDGSWRIKDAGMREAAARAQVLASKFTAVHYVAVPREQNREADRLVNHALDQEQ